MISRALSLRAVWLSSAVALLAGALVGAAVWVGTPAGIHVPQSTGQLAGSRNGGTTALGREPVLSAKLSHLRGKASTSAAYAVQAASSAQSGGPVRLAIPALNIAAGIIPVNAAGGLLGVPGSISEVGWWASGGIPAAPTGTVVLDGHVDSAVSGLGALWPLRFARPGQLITLSLAGGRHLVYRVTGLRSYPKANLPAGLFSGRNGPAALAVITCDGPFDRATGHYEDNLVVYAVPNPSG